MQQRGRQRQHYLEAFYEGRRAYRNALRELAKVIRWIAKEAILAIHTELIAEHGGSHGIRDAALLESTLARSQNLASYADEPTLHELAAGYAFGIVKNHPFIGGNKRTGLMAAYVSLHLNGKRLVAAEIDTVVATTKLAAGKLTEAQLAAWLGKNSPPLR